MKNYSKTLILKYILVLFFVLFFFLSFIPQAHATTVTKITTVENYPRYSAAADAMKQENGIIWKNIGGDRDVNRTTPITANIYDNNGISIKAGSQTASWNVRYKNAGIMLDGTELDLYVDFTAKMRTTTDHEILIFTADNFFMQDQHGPNNRGWWVTGAHGEDKWDPMGVEITMTFHVYKAGTSVTPSNPGQFALYFNDIDIPDSTNPDSTNNGKYASTYAESIELVSNVSSEIYIGASDDKDDEMRQREGLTLQKRTSSSGNDIIYGSHQNCLNKRCSEVAFLASDKAKIIWRGCGVNMGTYAGVVSEIEENPQISLTKTITSPSSAQITKAGDQVQYKLTITNDGNVALNNIQLTDDKISNENLYTSTNALLPGASTEISVTYTATQDDANATGAVVNHADVIGASVISGTTTRDNDEASFTSVATPGIKLEKDYTGADPRSAAVGDTAPYTFIITNTGNVTLHNIKLTDTKISGSNLSSTTDLDPGKYIKITDKAYSIGRTDIDNGIVTNIAKVTATGARGGDVSATDNAIFHIVNPHTLTYYWTQYGQKQKKLTDATYNYKENVTVSSLDSLGATHTPNNSEFYYYASTDWTATSAPASSYPTSGGTTFIMPDNDVTMAATETRTGIRMEKSITNVSGTGGIKNTDTSATTNITNRVSYQLKVTSVGNRAAHGITIYDTFTSGFASAGGAISNIKIYKNTTAISATTTMTGNCGFQISPSQELAQNEYFLVTYDVTFGKTTSTGLQGKTWTNSAYATANDAPVTSTKTASVQVRQPVLKTKKSVDKDTANVNEKVGSTITISHDSSSDAKSIAYNVIVTDEMPGFSDAGGSISSIKCYLDEKEFTPTKIEQNNNGHFKITTGKDLQNGSTIKITYQINTGEKNSTALLDKTWTNTVTTTVDNTSPTTDKKTIKILKPILKIDKNVEVEKININETAKYTVTVSQDDTSPAGARAYDVILNDFFSSNDFGSAGGEILGDSIVVTKNDSSYSPTITKQKTSFTINLGNIERNDRIVIEYNVKFGTTTSVDLQKKSWENQANITSPNADSKKTEKSIYVRQPVIAMSKSANKEKINTGDTVTYSLVAYHDSASEENSRAYNVCFNDVMNYFDEFGGTVLIDTVKAVMNDGTEFVPTISTTNDITDIVLNRELKYGEQVTVTFNMRFGAYNNEKMRGRTWINTATVTTDNAGKADDDAKVYVYRPALTISKRSSVEDTNINESVRYTITIDHSAESEEGSIARLLHFEDSFNNLTQFTNAGGALVPNSVTITKLGEAAKHVLVTGNKISLDLGDLAYDERFTISYVINYGGKSSYQLEGKRWYNTATVTSPGVTTHHATDNVRVRTPHLSADKTSSKKWVNTSQGYQYTVVLTSDGEDNSIAWNVGLDDTLDKLSKEGGAYIDLLSLVIKDNNDQRISSSEYTVSPIKSVDGKLVQGYSLDTTISLRAGEHITVTYNATAGKTTSVNLIDSNISNTATPKNPNNNPDNPGTSDYSVTQVYRPSLTLHKEAAEDIVNTSEEIHYTITVTQNVSDAIAWNVCVEDAFTEISANAGSYIKTGTFEVKKNNVSVPFTFTGKTGTSERPTSYLLSTSSYLEKGDTLTITYIGVAGDTVSRQLQPADVVNNAYATSDNSYPSIQDEADVKIYTPSLNFVKKADEEIVNTAEEVHYHLIATQEVPGAIAWNVSFNDALDETTANAGAYISTSSFVLLKNGQVIEPSKYSIEFNNNNRPTSYRLTSQEDCSIDDCVEVSYIVIAGDKESRTLQETGIKNKANATADNTDPSPEDNEDVNVYTPALKIIKSANTKKANTSDTIHYTLTTEQTVQKAIAWNVNIEDHMEADAIEAGAYIDASTIKVISPTGEDITSASDLVTSPINGDETSISDFVINTSAKLSYEEHLIVEYDVVAGTTESVNLYDTGIKNYAIATSSNSDPSPQDDEEVHILRPELSVNKEPNKTNVSEGDTATFTIAIHNTGEDGSIAWNTCFTDSFSWQGQEDDISVEQVQDSIEVLLNGAPIDIPVSIVQEKCSLSISASEMANLETNDELIISYTIRFGNAQRRSMKEQSIINTVIVASDNTELAQDDATIEIANPVLEISKSSTVSLIDTLSIGNIPYSITVSQTKSGAVAHEAKVEDSLEESTIHCGYSLNKDVKISLASGEDVTSQCSVSYKTNGEQVIGYIVELPDSFEYGTTYIISYTADAKTINPGNEPIPINNTATATALNADKVISAWQINSTVVADELIATGLFIPGITCFALVFTAAIITSLLIRRKRKQ